MGGDTWPSIVSISSTLTVTPFHSRSAIVEVFLERSELPFNSHAERPCKCYAPYTRALQHSGCLDPFFSESGRWTPNDMPTGRQGTIHAERDRKLEEARQQRRVRRSQADRPDALATEPSVNHTEVQILAS
jgi:hypothetical protein